MTTLEQFPPLARYLEALAALERDGIKRLEPLLAARVRFCDPFNDCRGRERVLAVFADMLEQLADIDFRVIDRPASAGPGETLLVRWRLAARLRRLGNRPWCVTGCAALRFDDDGLLLEHVDYWDAAAGLYEQLPLIGPVMRFLRRRLQVPQYRAG